MTRGPVDAYDNWPFFVLRVRFDSDMLETRQDKNYSRKKIQSSRNYDMPVPSAFGKKKHKRRERYSAVQCCPERHGYHVIKMTWPVPGH